MAAMVPVSAVDGKKKTDTTLRREHTFEDKFASPNVPVIARRAHPPAVI